MQVQNTISNVKAVFADIRLTNNRIFDDAEERLDMWTKAFTDFFYEGRGNVDTVVIMAKDIIRFLAKVV